jgi:hypothetical protein
MKRILFLIVCLSILAFACDLSTTTPAVSTQPPVPTMVNTQPSAPPTETLVVATDTPSGPQANVTCNELSFYLDPLVAFNYTCTTVPQQLVGIGAHPQYTQVTLTTYQTGSSVSPEIDVFSVQSYNDDFPPNGISKFRSDLLALILGGTPGDTLPYLNPLESAQIIHAQYQVLQVPNGAGIRYLTEYAQNYAVIDNHDLFYTYQGLTNDERYVITAILPVSNPVLPNHGDTYPGGETFQQFSDAFNTYIADTKTQLDAQSPTTYAPSLTLLDALIQSIHIQP